MNIWKALNSPFVITLLILVSAFAALQVRKNVVAGEIRGVYDELMEILAESSDADRQMVVRDFVQELSGEVIGGFKDAFQSDSNEEKEELKKMIDLRRHLRTSNPTNVPQSWGGKEAYVFELTNDSDVPVGSISLNYSFLREDKLIDAETENIREIEVLMPGESISLKAERDFDDESEQPTISDRMEITVLSLKTKSF